MKFFGKWTLKGRNKGTSEYCPEFEATVPGNAQWDYAKSHGMENFTFSDGVYAFKEIEDYEWLYETILDFNAKKGEKVFFVAEGIDYQYEIFLNDENIYSGEGMYSKIEIDITDKAQKGSKLSVFVYAPPKRDDAPKGTRDEADRFCKPPVSYGWDWNPRLLISGLWKPCYIETRSADYIYNCEPFYTLNADRTTAKVRFETVCDGKVEYTVKDPMGKVVYNGTENEFELNNIALWWCNGQGEPNLYAWTAKTETDEKCGHIGFRTVKLVHNEGVDKLGAFPKGRYPCPITIELNGRRIFAKGSNWVNPDVFFGRVTDDRYKELVPLAKEANMNIFRCWGGAGINKESFYEECDKNGIMVWQEFMLACNNYIDDPHYLSVLKKEATSIIKALRKYPSLVLWCGGNELFNDWSGMDDQSLVLRTLNALCLELDSKNPFIMTSPVFGMAHGNYSFMDWDDGKDVFYRFTNSANTAYTEFGVGAIAAEEDLRTIIPENELFPIVDTPAWRAHHGFGAWIMDTWVCHSVINRYFGEDDNLKDRIAHSNWLQSMGYKAIFEEARRQWGRCSMAINWCFNEPWLTVAGNSLLSYPAKPKPAYFEVKKSLRNVMPSARIKKFEWEAGETFTAELWYHNDGVNTESDTISVSITLDGKENFLLEWKTGEVLGGKNKLGPAVNLALPEFAADTTLYLKIKSQNGFDNEYKLMYINKAANQNENKTNV